MAKSYREFLVGAATATLVGATFAGAVSGASNFSDIKGLTHEDAIKALVDKGIIKGYPDGTFKASASIKRGDAAVMVARALGILDGKSVPSTSFKDLGGVNKQTQEAIAKLADREIISGFNKDTFAPNQTITRAQMAKYIANAFNLPVADGITKFPDVNKNAALAQFVDALADAGITKGKANGTFGYHDNLNRGDFAAMVHRALNADPIPGINPLTIASGDNKGNSLTNGEKKTYTVTLINPVSKKPVENATVNVTFKENLETDFGAHRKVTVTNAIGGNVIPFQANDGQEQVAEIKTDRFGKATFTITGTNATVTPIVFLDGSNQRWNTEGGIEINTKDGRFDRETELYAEADAVTFGVTAYKIDVSGNGTNYAAISEVGRAQGSATVTEHNGREYKIKVTKPDGTPYAGATLNVGIDEYVHGKLGEQPRAAFLTGVTSVKNRTIGTPVGNITAIEQGTIRTDANGEAKFKLHSTHANDSAKPTVWIDQNFDNNDRNHVFEEGEPISVRANVDPTNFLPSRVDNAKLEVRDLTDAARAHFRLPTGFNEEDVKGFNFVVLNQSNQPFLPGTIGPDARVSFEVVNTGTSPVRIHTATFLGEPRLQNAQLADFATVTGTPDGSVVQIEVGGRVTISGNINRANWYNPANSAIIAAYAVGGKSSVSVSVDAVVNANVGNESRNVAVKAGPKEAELRNTSGVKHGNFVKGIVERDRNNNGSIDEIEITFDGEVKDFEAGDFRLVEGTTGANEPAIDVDYGKRADDISREDKKKIVLKVEEFAGIGATELHYDPSFSGSKALTGEFGNEVRAFKVTKDGADYKVESR